MESPATVELISSRQAGSRRLPDGSKLEVLLLVDNNEPPEVLHFVEAKHIRSSRLLLLPVRDLIQ